MEETMGKRISAARKRLGLTQDKLAEQLGVTAQAVSKWENDQACPDIAMLPRLADIFGITTDELLGIERKTVHQAEIVEDGSLHEDDKDENSGWEFTWDGGRKHHLGFAIWVLAVGGLLLLSNLLEWDAGFWDLAWPSALLIYGLAGMFPHFRFSRIACTLVGAYYLLDEIGLLTDKLPSGLIFPLILVVLGMSLLADAFRKSRKPTFHIRHHGKNTGKTKNDCYNTGDSFSCGLSFGEYLHYVDVPVLRGGEASLSFGELTVDLQGCREIAENCTIKAACAFGEMKLIVPKRYQVKAHSGTTFGSMNIEGQPDPQPQGIIHLDAGISFGELEIEYV